MEVEINYRDGQSDSLDLEGDTLGHVIEALSLARDALVEDGLESVGVEELEILP